MAIELAFYKHQIDKENRGKRRWLNAILSSITDGLISTDREGIINFFNPVAEKLLGKNTEAVVGKQLEDIFLIQEGPTGRSFGLDLTIISSGFAAEQDYYLRLFRLFNG